MEWWLALLFIFGGLLVLMATKMPIVFCFMTINVIGMYIFLGGQAGLEQLTLSMFDSVTTFLLLPLPLFILMGEVMYYSGVAPLMIDAIDKWLGRLPGRLSLLGVAAGTVFATLTGAEMASAAMLGTMLIPEMEKRGYKKPMTVGPIMASGGLAIMIPPSGLAVLLGAIGEISIGKILIAIIVPGFIMAALYSTYIIGRSWLQPQLAPAYEIRSIPIQEKMFAAARYILPIGLVIFLVLGVILLGIATPTEAAATGAIGAFILAAAYRKLNWQMSKSAMFSALQVAAMILMILTGARAYGQVLAASGASRAILEFLIHLDVSAIFVLILMQAVVLVMGMFMDPVAIMMIALPIFMPVVEALGFDPVWFAVTVLLAIEIGTRSPPFGTILFVMKGVVPPNYNTKDIYLATTPFILLDLLVMALLIAIPQIALWLPGLMVTK